jgi:tetratricopeptide (TPR) repeat protein
LQNNIRRFFSRLSVRRVLLKTCLAGAIAALITGGALFALLTYSGQNLFTHRDLVRESVFSQKLKDYDQAAGDPAAESGDEHLSRLLDELEKIALGVESHLSVLKRRRALAVGSAPGSASVHGAGRSWSGSNAALAGYRASAERIAALFPHSEALAAIAAEAVTRSVMRENAAASPPLSGAAADQVRQYAAAIGGEVRLAPVALSAYILAGDLANPGLVLTLPGGEELLLAAAEHRQSQGRESLILDAAILAVLKQNETEALKILTPLFGQAEESGIARTAALRFGAELLYDFGDPQKAADLFARFSDDQSLARRADSLVLAGRKDAARSFWILLSAPAESSGGLSVARDIRIRSLYNLAAAAADTDEEAAALERLIALDPEHLFGIIRYTRLLPAPRAAAILEGSALPNREALADLELLRRRQENWSIDRTVPETWLLINRHPRAEVLYQWAGYYFTLQRRYSEIPPLLRSAGQNGFTGSWLDLQQALEYIRQGRFDEAEGILKAKAAAGDSWEIHANLGRLLEAKRASRAALEIYKTAASLVREKTDAAKIQWRIARCLRALGQERESLKVLEYAQTLDKENLTIRLERERVEQSLY